MIFILFLRFKTGQTLIPSPSSRENNVRKNPQIQSKLSSLTQPNIYGHSYVILTPYTINVSTIVRDIKFLNNDILTFILFTR